MVKFLAITALQHRWSPGAAPTCLMQYLSAIIIFPESYVHKGIARIQAASKKFQDDFRHDISVMLQSNCLRKIGCHPNR